MESEEGWILDEQSCVGPHIFVFLVNWGGELRGLRNLLGNDCGSGGAGIRVVSVPWFDSFHSLIYLMPES